MEPDDRRVRIFVWDGERYAEAAHIAAFGVGAAALKNAIPWP